MFLGSIFRNTSQKYFQYFPKISNIFEKYFGKFREILPKKVPKEFFLKISSTSKIRENYLGKCQEKFPKPLRNISGSFENITKILKNYFEKFRGLLRRISRSIS